MAGAEGSEQRCCYAKVVPHAYPCGLSACSINDGARVIIKVCLGGWVVGGWMVLLVVIKLYA